MSDETNVQQTMVTGKCEQCGEDIIPAATEGIFKRNLGMHMWQIHGVAGKWREKRRKKEERKRQIAALRSAQGLQPLTTPKLDVNSVEGRRQRAIKAVTARWAIKGNTVRTVDGMTDEQLGADMELQQVHQLTPAQKRRRATLHKAKWWRNRYHAEKNGTKPVSSITSSVTRSGRSGVSDKCMVPVEFREKFTSEELSLLNEMTNSEGAELSRRDPTAYQRRNALKSRLSYWKNRDSILASQRASLKRKKDELDGAPPAVVSTPSPLAVPCKLSECPNCGTRFWMTKERTEQ